MAGITGQGTSFNLPNFVGELFAASPTDTPFLSAIGGLTGGEAANATLFTWQGFDLRDADEGRQRLEGADAPDSELRVRYNAHNVVEIHHESLELSYTKLATSGQMNATGGQAHQAQVGGSNPVLNEMDWQLRQALVQIGRDIEKTFIVGSFANPSTNATPRKTRGIIEATETNAFDKGTLVGDGASTFADTGEVITEAAHGLTDGDAVIVRDLTGGAAAALEAETLYYVINSDANTFQLARREGGSAIAFDSDGTGDVYAAAPLTEEIVLDLLQDVWTAGGISESETATLMVGATLKRGLTKTFITDKGYEEGTRTVGGVHVQTIETDFGILNLMLNRYMPSGVLQVVSLEECALSLIHI